MTSSWKYQDGSDVLTFEHTTPRESPDESLQSWAQRHRDEVAILKTIFVPVGT